MGDRDVVQELDTITTNLNTTMTTVDGVDSRLSAAELSVASLGDRVGQVEQDVAAIDIPTVSGLVQGLDGRVTTLENEVLPLVPIVNTNTGAIASLQVSAQLSKDRLDLLEPLVATNSGNISNLQTRMNVVETVSTTNTSDIATNATAIAARLPSANINRTLVGDVTINSTPTAGAANITLYNPVSQTTTSVQRTIPIVSTGNAGFAAAADKVQLNNHESRLDALEGQSNILSVTIPWTAGNEPLTYQAQLTALYQTPGSGQTSPGLPIRDGFLLIDAAQNLTYRWLLQTQSWLYISPALQVATTSQIGGVLSSSIAGNIAVSSTGVMSLNGFAGLQNGINDNDNAIQGLDGRMTTAEGNISTNATNISTNGTAISGLGSRMTTAEGNINGLATRMGTAEANIIILQNLNVDVQTDITGLQGRMSTAEGNISTLQGSITGFGSAISTLQTQVGTNTGNILTNSNDIATIQTQLSGLQGVSTQTASHEDLITATGFWNAPQGRIYHIQIADNSATQLKLDSSGNFWYRNRSTTTWGSWVQSQNLLPAGTAGALVTQSGTAGSLSVAAQAGSASIPIFINSSGMPTQITTGSVASGNAGLPTGGAVFTAVNAKLTIPTGNATSQYLGGNGSVQNKGSIASGNTGLVDGDTVFTALSGIQVTDITTRDWEWVSMPGGTSTLTLSLGYEYLFLDADFGGNRNIVLAGKTYAGVAWLTIRTMATYQIGSQVPAVALMVNGVTGPVSSVFTPVFDAQRLAVGTNAQLVNISGSFFNVYRRILLEEIVLPGVVTNLTKTDNGDGTSTFNWGPPATGTGPFSYQYGVGVVPAWSAPTTATTFVQATGLPMNFRAINKRGPGPLTSMPA